MCVCVHACCAVLCACVHEVGMGTEVGEVQYGLACECISSYVCALYMYMCTSVRTCPDMLCYGTVCVHVSAELQWPWCTTYCTYVRSGGLTQCTLCSRRNVKKVFTTSRAS